MTCKLSVKAAEDVEQIWLYTLNKWSREQADAYVLLIFEELKQISRNPLKGKDIGAIRANYRSVLVKSHLIYYRIIEENNVVEVIRILHERMDVNTRL